MDTSPITVRTETKTDAPGSSFDEELAALLRRRCRLAFLLGLTISVTVLGLHWLVLKALPMYGSPFSGWMNAMRAAHVSSFLFGLGATALGRAGPRRLQLTAFIVIAVNLIVAVASHTVIWPDVSPFFAVALLLFGQAGFIPSQRGYQIVQATVAVLSCFCIPVVTYGYLPEIRSFWASRGGEVAFWASTIWDTTGAGILGAVSVLIAGTLYRLRKKAHGLKRLGNYEIISEVGKGGMGEVYVARHARMCRPTALKVVHATGTGKRGDLMRFEREVRLSSALTHPNTITVFDYGKTGDSFYYAMEYLEGMDLEDLVERFGPLDPARVVFILLQICGSLAEAHSRNIIHRDIKPSNIFLTRRGDLYDFVKVLDFGLAKQIDTGAATAAAITQAGILFGTPRYLAPELIYGGAPIDARTDLYNVGAVAYWMLTGHAPFRATSSVALLIDHVQTMPPRPSEVSEVPIPEGLELLVMQCLAKKPQDRPDSAKALETALLALQFAEPWTREKAQAWWTLHAPEKVRETASVSA